MTTTTHNSIEDTGAFYLGLTPTTQNTDPVPVLLASKDFTTHAVCVGMTGSGKTGLCISLLEEAAIDRIPAIVIDVKGDLSNLALTFPTLDTEALTPWIDATEASRLGKSPSEFAADQASRWQEGLRSTLQTTERITALKQAANIHIYTPGSTAGTPLAVLGAMSIPSDLQDDPELLNEHLSQVAASILALLGESNIEATSREMVLLCKILDAHVQNKTSTTVEMLITHIQKPPFEKVGMMDVETFYPAKERMELALKLNQWLASPSASLWMTGAPLHIPSLLWDAQGKPNIAIISIAHLQDAERMFFVSRLLAEVLAWTRRQSGTSSLRALLFMDEVFGFLPPVANPPSKQPFLLLLKQARAFGLGVVVATQNPVDIDYKALANTGIWFLGRLQTEQDQERLLDGLTTASSIAWDRNKITSILSSLQKRQFLVQSIYEKSPFLMNTRCTLSYLRGPLGRQELKKLKDQHAPLLSSTATPSSSSTSTSNTSSTSAVRPALPPSITELFPTDMSGSILVPRLVGKVKVHFVDAKNDVDLWQEQEWHGFCDDESVNPFTESIAEESNPWTSIAPQNIQWGDVPSTMLHEKNYTAWKKQLIDAIYQRGILTLQKDPQLGITSLPGETASAFMARLQLSQREVRDTALEEIKQEYLKKLSTIEDKITRAEAQKNKEKEQAQSATFSTALELGSSVFGALFGKKMISATNMKRAATSARSVGRAMEQRGDVGRAEEKLELLLEQKQTLEDEMNAALENITSMSTPHLEEKTIKPRKSDIIIEQLFLGWVKV